MLVGDSTGCGGTSDGTGEVFSRGCDYSGKNRNLRDTEGMRKLFFLVIVCFFSLAAFVSCNETAGGTRTWDHIVLVWEENRDAAEVNNLPYISRLRAAGRTYTKSYGVARPSQPNYIALFAGSTMGVADNLDHDLVGPNLYSRFVEANLAMISYAEGLPSTNRTALRVPIFRRPS
jgi:hypothetical protein